MDFAVSQEWMTELSWFFCMLISVKKVKSSRYMHRVKYGCDVLGPGIIKSASSQEYIDELG